MQSALISTDLGGNRSLSSTVQGSAHPCVNSFLSARPLRARGGALTLGLPRRRPLPRRGPSVHWAKDTPHIRAGLCWLSFIFSFPLLLFSLPPLSLFVDRKFPSFPHVRDQEMNSMASPEGEVRLYRRCPRRPLGLVSDPRP